MTMRAIHLGALALLGCAPSIGPCDPEGPAFELVYDAFGTPATAGQAQAIQGCANGHCHADGIAEADRFGAPVELGFDVRLASTGPEGNIEETARLSEHQARMARMRGEIWQQVHSGQMPPDSPEEGVVATGQYDRVADDGVTFATLPAVDTPEGLEIFRAWLACGVPVVERTRAPVDIELEDPIGFTARACQRRCVDPTWGDIQDAVIAPRCATAACHAGDEAEASLDLSASDALLATLTLRTPATCAKCMCDEDEVAATMPMITPGDPEMSLLYLKVEPGRACGATMPLTGSLLSEQARCALREWIACGAPAEVTAEDEACIEAARVTCQVTVEGGEAACVTVDTCDNRAPLDG